MDRKSRHYRDESDVLLGYYHQTLAETSSVRNSSNPLYSSSAPAIPLGFSPERNNNNNTGGSGGEHSSSRARHVSFHDTNNFDNNINSNNNNNNDYKPTKKSRYRVHRVSYTAQDHVGVLFRMYGSAFPSVVPFCLANIVWTLVVHFLRSTDTLDLTFHSSDGHSFMGLLVSFLLVTRSRISYDRFMEMRKLLAKAYRTCREIAQLSSVYTFHTQTAKAKEWRQEVCYRTILLLRVTMDALLWSSTEREKWEEEYYQYQIKQQEDVDGSYGTNGGGTNSKHRRNNKNVQNAGEDDNVSEHFLRVRKLFHGRRSRIDENFRAPITLAHILKMTIMRHPEYLDYKMPVNEYRDLVLFVATFVEAFHGFRVLIFTPYPFPLVQMTRAFLLFWVYTLPLTLLKVYRLWSCLIIVALVTFGFVGIEYVCIALDDPFSDDTNDVDEHGMALLVYEDIYVTIYRTDGPASAAQLRERVLQRYKQGRGLDCYRDDLKGYDIWEPEFCYHHGDDDGDLHPPNLQPEKKKNGVNDNSSKKV